MSASHQSASPGDRSPSTGANVPLLVGLYAATTDDDDDDMDFTPGFEELDSDEEYEDASEERAESEFGFDLGGDAQTQADFIRAVMAEEDDEEDSEDISSPDDDEEEEDDDDEAEEEDPSHQTGNAETGTRRLFLSREQLMSILGTASFRNILQSHSGQRWILSNRGGDEASGEESSRWTDRRARREARLEPVPNPTGRDLMMSGTFGNNERRPDKILQAKRAARRVLEREIGGRSFGREKSGMGLLKQNMIPESEADAVIRYHSRCYSGQFSADGTFFFSCGQDFKVRMYDTSNPYDWKYYKAVDMPYGQWTITDASLSADNRFLAYSSLTHIVCLASTDLLDDSTPRTLDFTKRNTSSRRSRHYREFGILSVRFSGDGRELVAGTGDHSVYVFDIERNESVLRIPGHEDDVNAVCFGDLNSPHILYSGSDDTTLKVWDRRSMGDGRAAGVFLGHTEGLTYVDSKGDGRYIISNGKDQTAKLWDLRKVIPTEDADKLNISSYSQGWNYSRGGPFDMDAWRPHPHDCSLVTFRGHSVEKTLIRCHFSPPGSSDGRYVYSGSQDGKVYIWNLDATPKGTIDVAASTRYLRERGHEPFDPYWGRQGQFKTVVRDASWHPHVPMIAATAWNGWGTALGTCSIHSWNEGLETDEAFQKKGLKLDAKLRPDEPEEGSNEARLHRQMRFGV